MSAPSTLVSRPTRSSRRWLTTLAVAAAALISIPGTATAAAAPSAQDTTYLTANMQTSLAEITIGNLALSKSDDSGVRDLANMTIKDHTDALAKASALAQTLGIPVPTEPSVDQKADAAKLQAASGDAFDQLYAQVQVAGHTKSIASTNTEITAGTDSTVVDYAKAYLPVATMHLEMAQKLVDAVGGTPTSVPAGTGGMAADGVDPLAVSLVVVGLLAVVGGFLFFRTRSTRESNR